MVSDTIETGVIPTKRPKKQSRHNVLADGNTLISFVIPLSLKREINRIAAADGVTPSEFMRQMARNTVRRHLAAKKAAQQAAGATQQ
jgi:hypothetical protein